MELEKCLINKSTNSFTSAPEFAELVAMVQKFHELLSLTPFTHFDLEMALQEENNQPQETTMEFNGEKGQQPGSKRSPLIENLLAEILVFFSIRFDSSNLSRKLYTLVGNINRWCIPQFDTRLMLSRKRNEEIETKMKENGRRKQNVNRKGGLEEEDDKKVEEENGKDEERMEKMTQQSGSQELTNNFNQDALNGRSQREQQQDDLESSNGRSQSQASSSNSTNQNGRENSVIGSSGGRRLYGIALYHKMNVPDYLNMTAEEKLHFLCFLVDAQLVCAEDSGHLDKEFMVEQQRHLPLVIDRDGRKFWYFSGDTWLFMEEGRLMNAEEEERMAEERMQKKKKAMEEEMQKIEKKTKNGKMNNKKTKKNGKDGKAKLIENKKIERQKQTEIITQKKLDEIYCGLFTGHRLRVVSKCTDHFYALIAAYKSQQQQKNAEEGSEFIEKLEQCAQQVKAIEEERLRKASEQAKKSLSPARQSSRIAKMLEDRRVVEEQRQRRHAAIMAEKKRLEIEQEEFLREHRRLTDSEIQTPAMSREDRLKMRQQRIQEQLEREQLIEAGLLTPCTSTMTADEEEMPNNELVETEEEEEYRGNEEFGGKLGEKRRKIVIGEMMAASMMKRGKRSLMLMRENADRLEEYEQRGHKNERMGGSRGDWWHPGEQKMAFASTSTPTATTSSDGSFISLFQRQSPYENRLFNSNQNNSNNQRATRKMPWRASAANHLCVSGGSGRSVGTGAGCDWIRNALKLMPNENEGEAMKPRFTFATRQPLTSQMSPLPLPIVKKPRKGEMESSSIWATINNNNRNKFSKWAQVNPSNALKTAKMMINAADGNEEERREKELDNGMEDEEKFKQQIGIMDEQNNNSKKSPLPQQLPCPQIC